MTREPLTEVQIDQAIEALMRWFKTQDLTPQDAEPIMIRLGALLLVNETRDIDQLQKAVTLWRDFLVLEIAGFLRK